MTKTFRHFAVSTALLLGVLDLSGHAQAKAIQSFGPFLQPEKALPTLCAHDDSAQGSLHLQSPDHSRLELARAYRVYLETKGQDGAAVNAIYKASLQSGVDFELLLLKAIMESDLGQFTEASGSSARGLFQYIEPTWLALMKRYGAELGYAHYAEAISYARGSALPHVKNKNKYLKAEILALRYDDDLSAMMKALQIKEETAMLRQMKGAPVNATDHYISHMLGLPLAKELYELRRRGSVFAVARLGNPQMREAAKLNRPFFYQGRNALTAADVYKKFEARVNREFKNIYSIENKGKNAICTAAKMAL